MRWELGIYPLIIILSIILIVVLVKVEVFKDNVEYQPIDISFLKIEPTTTRGMIRITTPPVFLPNGLCLYPEQCINQNTKIWGAQKI